MSNKSSPKQELKKILRSNKQMAKLSDSSLDAVSAAIEKSGILIPQAAHNMPGAGTDSENVQLTKLDIVLFALTSNPNKWYLVFTGNNPRQDIGLYQLGKCFEMIRRKENGKVNHYARYTGKPMNETGKRRMESLRKKMDRLGKIASSNKAVGIQNVTPLQNGNSGKTSVKALSKRTAKTKKTKKTAAPKKTPKYSREHASMYPLTADEKVFLDFLNSSPRTEHVLSRGTKANDTWHCFRWKWQSRYGFDLSQISIRQEKQADGTYNIYGTYTPNAVNMMNPGLKEFYDFLMTKGRSFSQIKTQIQDTEVIFG